MPQPASVLGHMRAIQRATLSPESRPATTSWWTCEPQDWPAQYAKAVQRMIGSREAAAVNAWPSLSKVI